MSKPADRRIVIIIMAFALALAAPAAAQKDFGIGRNDPDNMLMEPPGDVHAMYLYYLEDETGFPEEIYYKQNDPPMLERHIFEPENPGPDDEITVTALIRNNHLITDSETLDATFYYSYDGGESWYEQELEELGGGEWTTTIAPIGAPVTLYYLFTAVDDLGNYYLEIPSTPIDWESQSDAPFFITVEDNNSVPAVAPDNLDITSVSIGYDGTHYYFNINVEGEISGGTITPLEANLYHAGFFLPDNRGVALNPDLVLGYSELASFFTMPEIALYDIDRAMSEVESADPQYYVRDNSLFMRINRMHIDEGKCAYMRMIFGTARRNSRELTSYEPIDVSVFNNVMICNRYIEIE